jgi:hypothetical protein
MSWDEFQPYLDTWKDTQETACTIVSKDEIYITKVVFLYDTDKVHELEKGSADEIEEYAITHSYFGLPVIVYLHLIGHLKTRLSLPPIR